jgi:GTP-binding protein HflX
MSKDGASRPVAAPPVRTLVLCPDLRGETSARSPSGRLEEARGLAAAIHVDIVEAQTIALREINPATLFGRGKVAQLAALVADHRIELVIVDHALSPGQQRELEKALQAKVIDRTGLILEIFGERARTREGQLQVELAALDYQRSRLVRSWTHLERQRGGFGFLGGPGESQLEIDRRLILGRITRIRADLEAVKRSRSLQREARTDPAIALVGYTNAGKSTLFNRLSQSGVMAADMLFATLDPTIRRVVLPSGWPVVISDTVGFISELPTGLVAAFSATLEEVRQADIILHVRDAAHPETRAQREDVLQVLENDLGIPPGDERIIEVLNKIDLMRDRREMNGASVAISAMTGDGIAALLTEIDRKLALRRRIDDIAIDLADGKALAHVYRQGRVPSRVDEGGLAHMRVERRATDT